MFTGPVFRKSLQIKCIINQSLFNILSMSHLSLVVQCITGSRGVVQYHRRDSYSVLLVHCDQILCVSLHITKSKKLNQTIKNLKSHVLLKLKFMLKKTKKIICN